MDVLENWKEEKRAAYLYHVIARVEKNKVYKKLFIELAEMAEKQAAIWEHQLIKSKIRYSYRPDRKTRFIAWLIRRFGPRYLRFLLSATKIRGMSIYRATLISNEMPPHVGSVEHLHNGMNTGSNIRAAVFGINDGVLSNASLILGIAGAHLDHHVILLSGIAGLLAGAISMGSGEYVSVRTQREMLEYQLALEKHELETYPEEEAAELAIIYEARGLPRAEAKKVAQLLIQQPQKALDTLAREELGINPDDLVSPWGAAISSFVSFTIGALIPLLPFILDIRQHELAIAIGLTLMTLFCIGTSISFFTQRNMWWSGLRTLLIGVTAGASTFAVGSLFGIQTT